MRVLIIGNPDSFWVKEFAKNVLLPLGADVFIQRNAESKSQFEEFYKKNEIKIIGEYKIFLPIMKIPKIKVLHTRHKKKKALKKCGVEFDFIFILYVTPYDLRYARAFSGKNTKIFSIFIGSDIIRSGKRNTKRLAKQLVKTKPSVLCSLCHTYDMYNEKLKDITGIPAQMTVFGTSGFEYIDKHRATPKAEHKAAFGIDPERISVCIGYNAIPEQQHERVIEKLAELPQEEKEKIFLVLPMAYGWGGAQYIERVRQKLSNSQIDFCILTEFFDLEKIATLRLATDIFINSQTTDAFCASIRECLYADTVVLNALWLHYREIDEWGLRVEEFSSFEELPKKLSECMKKSREEYAQNREILAEKSSWNNCLEIIKNIISNTGDKK